jgi:ATPase family AAA domain-containing protein 3A/B
MSWLFGLRKGGPEQGEHGVPDHSGGDNANVGGGAGGGREDGSRNAKKGDAGLPSMMDSYRFDSAALERAAKAARELESSSRLFETYSPFTAPSCDYTLLFIAENAKEALELTKLHESTLQLEHQKGIKVE